MEAPLDEHSAPRRGPRPRLPLHAVAAYGLVALGVVHTAFALCFGTFSADSVWFAGAGLALVFLGLLNLAADAAGSPHVWRIARVANLVGVAFGGAAAVTVWEPQGYLGLLLLVTLAITSYVGPAGALAVPSLTGAIAAAALFGLGAVAASYMLVGCVADGHPWFQVASWALTAPALAAAAWVVLRRLLGTT